jgi:hypothetical protein
VIVILAKENNDMKPSQKPYIVQHSFASLVEGARLDAYHESGTKVVLEVQGFQPLSSKLFERDGKIHERVSAKYVPLKLIFTGVSELKRDDFFISLEDYSLDDTSRTIAYMLSWRKRNTRDVFYMFGLRAPADADMQFHARSAQAEKLPGSGKTFTVERNWSPPPPMPDRLAPEPKALYRRFGGDPISINLKDKTLQRRLFIGGQNIQPEHRPDVHAVLNIGETPSRWVKKDEAIHPNDRAVHHGEGSQGMTVEQLREEASWVIERLKQGKRVLVHCEAGMNRSTTICSAVLILLEGLSADDALARVREYHPWARPDSHHWLALRWLAQLERKK